LEKIERDGGFERDCGEVAKIKLSTTLLSVVL
jgi:hypothetical protein